MVKNQKPKSLVLSMIVKDEEAVIKRCLESVKPWISSWCIVDTGSSDRTKEIIRETMAGVPGELHERPWVNFGHNRTEALELAKSLGDWVLFMDADHVLDEDISFPELGSDGSDHYYLNIVNWQTTYQIIRIVRSDLPWYFDGATHEAITCPIDTKDGRIDSVTITEFPDGKRRASGDKTPNDIALLEQQVANEPNNSRAVFYLAQSYYDAEQYAKAFEWYVKRLPMGGYQEEVFWSLFRIGIIQQDTFNAWDKAMQAYLAAYQACPTRAEPLVILAAYYNNHNMPDVAKIYASRAMAMKVNPGDRLFVCADAFNGGKIVANEYARATGAA